MNQFKKLNPAPREKDLSALMQDKPGKGKQLWREARLGWQH